MDKISVDKSIGSRIKSQKSVLKNKNSPKIEI